MRKLIAYLNGQVVGTIAEGNDLWTFEYDAEWVGRPDSFDLSPALPRSKLHFEDGGSERPIQWYFDNLLPEEQMREVVSKQANIKGDDAFALLEYLGAESAGSLVLLPPGQDLPQKGGLRPLSDAELAGRIRNLPRVPLSSGAPKRMSVAGAQNKLWVVYRKGELFEPEGSEPSTHILKPNHVGDDFPASVINEYFTMSLARELGLPIPPIFRHYTPEPVYIVQRFDRIVTEVGPTQRRHIIDACQLLNKSRTFKYRTATLQTLAEITELCRNRAITRLSLYRWLVLNLLIANTDNHLKNLSFLVSAEGIDLAPAYDLVSTGTYHARAFANERANWPVVDLAIELPGATTLGGVNRESVLRAGEVLGLPRRIGTRELDRLVRDLPLAAEKIQDRIETENADYPAAVGVFLGGERRIVATIKHLIVREMVERLAPAQ
ncbi:MAG: HipA domain-containing protein [Proteobacteria bacterium]|nr:HipA domain-containing protein [Pseudomonadota bacterium]